MRQKNGFFRFLKFLIGVIGIFLFIGLFLGIFIGIPLVAFLMKLGFSALWGIAIYIVLATFLVWYGFYS